MAQPTALVVSASATAVSCNGGSNGSVNLTISGGTSAYSYVWDKMELTLQNINGLVAGTYTATVTDANGCSKTASATVTQPAALVASATVIGFM